MYERQTRKIDVKSQQYLDDPQHKHQYKNRNNARSYDHHRQHLHQVAKHRLEFFGCIRYSILDCRGNARPQALVLRIAALRALLRIVRCALYILNRLRQRRIISALDHAGNRYAERHSKPDCNAKQKQFTRNFLQKLYTAEYIRDKKHARRRNDKPEYRISRNRQQILFQHDRAQHNQELGIKVHQLLGNCVARVAR